MSWRLFTAITPPAEVIAELDRFTEPRRDADDRLRWTLSSSWHLTTAFLPSVDEHRLDGFTEALDGVAERLTGFPITLSGTGAFPDPDHAKVLWLGVQTGADELGRLASACRAAATRCGVPVDGARFRPHLTLARANGVPMLRWLRVFDALGPLSWHVDGFELIRSLTLPAGAGYTQVAGFRFGGAR